MDVTKLAKLLALAASENEPESVRAIRAAKGMLAAAELDFIDVANAVVAPAESAEFEVIDALRDKVAGLRRENRALKGEIRKQGGAPATTKADLVQYPAEVAARERAEATCARQVAELTELGAELRRLKAVTIYLKDELERSEIERFRLIAEIRKSSLSRTPRPQPRRSRPLIAEQYWLF